MHLLSFIKNNLFIQNFFSTLVALIHPFLENTLSKYTAIKKAMFMNYHDNTLGDYLEFKIYSLSSSPFYDLEVAFKSLQNIKKNTFKILFFLI